MNLIMHREWMLFRMELHYCFSANRIPVFILLALIGVALVVQESEVPPFIIVFLVSFAMLESQVNNILFRTPNELPALSMFPVSWRNIVLVKNVATVILMIILSFIFSMVILYFSPHPTNRSDLLNALLFSGTIIFPLLHIGNTESLRPRQNVKGWQIANAVQAAGMFFFVIVLSIPYILFSFAFNIQWLNIIYIAGTGIYWYRHSVPTTAFQIEVRKTSLCSTM